MKKSVLLIAMLCMFYLNIKAQEFEIAPTRMDFNLEPGQNGVMVLNVTNHSDKKRNYITVLNDWTIEESGNINYLNPGTTERSCTEWVTVTPSFFELAPNESKKINVLMKVPLSEIANSTKWAMLFVQEVIEKFETIGGDKTTSAGITVNPSIGVYVFQSPDSYNESNATISNFRKSEIQNEFKADVKNTGDKIIQGKIYLVITDLQKAEENQTEPKEFTLLPGVSRSLSMILPQNLEKGLYSIAAVLDYSDDKDLLGVVMDYEVR